MTSTVIKALIAAKKNFTAIQKDTQGHNYKYFDLAEIKAATNDALLSEGLLVIQHPIVTEADGLGITTEIHHEGGEFIKYDFHAPSRFTQVNQKGIQALGSIITYLKRYHLCAILGLAEDDDDGKVAVDNYKEPESQQAPKPKPKPKTIKEHKDFLPLKAVAVKHGFIPKLNEGANGDWENIDISEFAGVRAFVVGLVEKMQTQEILGQ